MKTGHSLVFCEILGGGLLDFCPIRVSVLPDGSSIIYHNGSITTGLLLSLIIRIGRVPDPQFSGFLILCHRWAKLKVDTVQHKKRTTDYGKNEWENMEFQESLLK